MFPFFPVVRADEMMRLGLNSAVMMAEAQAVIAMRFFGAMGMWPVSAGEEGRMVSEKIAAMQEAQLAAVRAAIGGASAAGIAEAALKPVGKRTKANAARLSRRGLKPRRQG